MEKKSLVETNGGFKCDRNVNKMKNGLLLLNKVDRMLKICNPLSSL